MFAGAELAPRQREVLLAQALDGLTRSYANDPPPATFRLIVSPMVTWIWIGALIAFARRAHRAVAAAARHGAPRDRRLRGPRGPRGAHPGLTAGARPVDLLLIIVVLTLIVVVVGAPLRRRGAEQAGEDAERAELEARREAKYREIRDAELDHRTGKLSEDDWRAQDRALRAEAVDILRRLDELGFSDRTPGADERDTG